MGRRGSGLRASGSSFSDFSLDYEFDIFTVREDEQPTTFDDAIENFKGSFSESSADAPPVFDFFNDSRDGQPIIGFNTLTFDTLTFDLQPRFLAANEAITLNGNQIDSVFSSDSSTSRNTDRIEYRLVNDSLSALGVDELTLFIEDSSSEDGFQIDTVIDNEVTPEPDDKITVTVTIDPDLATGNGVSESEAIEYIVSERLFASVDGGRISGGASSDTANNSGNIELGDIVYVEVSAVGAGDPDTSPDDELFVPIDPEATDDSASTQENTAISIDVLDNDNVGIIEFFDSTSASGGSVVLNGDLLKYTPAAGFTGQDTFQYTINNLGIESTAATVTVDVTEAEQPILNPLQPPTAIEQPAEAPQLNGDDVINGDNDDNTLFGGEGNNILYGNDGDDVLQTGSGLDNLQGGNGNDNLFAGGGNDILTGGDGNDTLTGGDGNDTIDAGSQDDAVFGSSGDDLINGGNGNDTLNGGAGHDVLVGDGGSDVFVVNTLGGNDIIRDFNFDNDVIGLSDGITFDQITISQGNGAAIIDFNGQSIASISGGTPSQFDASKFIEI